MIAPELFALALPIDATRSEAFQMAIDHAGQIADPIARREWEDAAFTSFHASQTRERTRRLSPDARAARAGAIAASLIG